MTFGEFFILLLFSALMAYRGMSQDQRINKR